MLRAALKTLAEFDTMHIELKQIAFECLSFALGSKTIIPPDGTPKLFVPTCTRLAGSRKIIRSGRPVPRSIILFASGALRGAAGPSRKGSTNVC